MADESKFEQAKGNIKETIGNATNNEELENEGQEDKTSGKAKEFVENAKDKANDFIDNLKIIFKIRKELLFMSFMDKAKEAAKI